MVRASLLVLFPLLLAVQSIHSARILAVFPHIGKSHYFMFQPFVYELAKRGHQLHVVTYFPDPSPPPNVTFINIKLENQPLFFNSLPLDALEFITTLHKLPLLGDIAQGFVSVAGLHSMGEATCNDGLSNPNFQKFLKEKHTFDLLIVEFFNTDCFASLAHVYNVPLIGIFSSVMMPWHNDRFGNPDNPAYISNHFVQYSSKMTFGERWSNAFITYAAKIFYRFIHDPVADAAVQKYIGANIPPVREIVKGTSLYLLNSHFSLFQPRPLVPSIIELGGFHVSPAKEIPKDILTFLDGSDGVIFFSMGSTVKGSTMPRYKLEIIQNVLSKLPYKVLWKWEEDVMPNKPNNVMIKKWVPQNEIFSHSKIKLFVTHSGLMGTEEAVYHGVPMLMMPLFGDQPVNAASCEEKGIGVIVDYYTLTEESFSKALNEALKPKYAENAKRVASIFMDRPLTMLDSAIYWTEYVIRYNGAPHLRSAAVDLPWYQEYLLDVISATVIVLVLFYKILKFLIFKLCCRQRKAEGKKKVKKH